MGVQMMAPMHRVDGAGVHHPCICIKDFPEDAYSHYDLRQFNPPVLGVLPADTIFTNVTLDNATFVADTCHNMEVCPLSASQ